MPRDTLYCGRKMNTKFTKQIKMRAVDVVSDCLTRWQCASCLPGVVGMKI